MKRKDLEAAADACAVALLGATLVAHGVTVRLVDLEAYGGSTDAASHAFRGETPRTRPMFGPPGHLYVYLSYGVHHCMNVVCGRVGDASAVLVRGVEVLEGEALVQRRRGRVDPGHRLDGPGRVCQGLAVDLALSGTDLFSAASPIRLRSGARRLDERVASGPRIGISKEQDRPWRFWLEAS